MKNRTKHLKVKIKSLAAESKIIRLEEKRAKNDETLRCTLHYHRVWDVRNEARWAQLAYGFLRGLEYWEIESKTRKLINWNRVQKLVETFGVRYDYRIGEHYSNTDRKKAEQKLTFEKWKTKAEKYIYAGCKGNSS